jgi:diamine N-acetyltransferase
LIEIIRPNIHHASVLAELGAKSFIESHGHSASEIDIQNYVSMNFNESVFKNELADTTHIYHLVLVDSIPAAYSKIRLNTAMPTNTDSQLCKMDRLYVLKEHYDKGLGKQLFDFNLNFAKAHDQKGFWLYVWRENQRALKFYDKQGFKNVGDTFFKISETHSNPNYFMLLTF